MRRRRIGLGLERREVVKAEDNPRRPGEGIGRVEGQDREDRFSVLGADRGREDRRMRKAGQADGQDGHAGSRDRQRQSRRNTWPRNSDLRTISPASRLQEPGGGDSNKQAPARLFEDQVAYGDKDRDRGYDEKRRKAVSSSRRHRSRQHADKERKPYGGDKAEEDARFGDLFDPGIFTRPTVADETPSTRRHSRCLTGPCLHGEGRLRPLFEYDPATVRGNPVLSGFLERATCRGRFTPVREPREATRGDAGDRDDSAGREDAEISAGQARAVWRESLLLVVRHGPRRAGRNARLAKGEGVHEDGGLALREHFQHRTEVARSGI